VQTLDIGILQIMGTNSNIPS